MWGMSRENILGRVTTEVLQRNETNAARAEELQCYSMEQGEAFRAGCNGAPSDHEVY